jgi:glycerophosphoryl diester phosphodiesterase
MAEGYPPENTLAAFKKALDSGADGFECDVHLSRDGTLVVFHDKTLKRMTGRNGPVGKRTLHFLETCDVRGEKIPTLCETLELVDAYIQRGRRILLNIELKGSGTAEPVCRMMEEYYSKPGWSRESFVVSSFDWEMLQQVRLHDPKIRIGALWFDPVKHYSVEEILSTLGFTPYAIHPVSYAIDPQYVELAQKVGVEIICWGLEDIPKKYRKQVYSPQEIKQLGLHAIITNVPDQWTSKN